jgi:hypothetical protein
LILETPKTQDNVDRETFCWYMDTSSISTRAKWDMPIKKVLLFHRLFWGPDRGARLARNWL